MVRLLLGENFPTASVVLLRTGGNDVRWANESFSGSTDVAVMEMAVREQCWIVTFNKD